MNALRGLKVLVVEDEGSVALLIEDMLQELGCEVVASVARLNPACEIAAFADLDLALLDVNLAGTLVFPVARILQERRVSFVFSTGYGASGLPDEFRNHVTVSKPFSIEDLARAIAAARLDPGEPYSPKKA
jgi:CheY-like chemotaxis protein